MKYLVRDQSIIIIRMTSKDKLDRILSHIFINLECCNSEMGIVKMQNATGKLQNTAAE